MQQKTYVTNTNPKNNFHRKIHTTGLQRFLLATNSAIGAFKDPTRADLVATLGDSYTFHVGAMYRCNSRPAKSP